MVTADKAHRMNNGKAEMLSEREPTMTTLNSCDTCPVPCERRGYLFGDSQHVFVLQKVQPALLGLMDGSVSTLAPIFATAGLTGRPIDAFFVGLAASVGAAISMGLAEALSDDGKVTGRGQPILRGMITGVATVIGGMLHTLPFLLTNLHAALHLAYVVVVFELLLIAYIRFRYMKTPLVRTVVQVIIGGAIVFAIGLWLGRLGAGS
jgi:VIT1/CCC1 family predicted Fe2+/Mn2+ transporter